MVVVPRPIARDLLGQGNLDLYLSNLPSELDRLSTSIGERWYKYTWFDRFMGALDSIQLGPLMFLLVAIYGSTIKFNPFVMIFAALMFILVFVFFWASLQHGSAPAGWIRVFHLELDDLSERVRMGLASSTTSFRMIRGAVFLSPVRSDILFLSETDGSRIYLMRDLRGTWVHVGPSQMAGALAEVVEGAAIT